MLVALFNKIFPKVVNKEENRVIDLFKSGDFRPLIDYFSKNEIEFDGIFDHKHPSPSGRIVVEDDMYYYITIDGVDLSDMKIKLPYEERCKLIKQVEDAVLSNIWGTVAYDAKHFGISQEV